MAIARKRQVSLVDTIDRRGQILTSHIKIRIGKKVFDISYFSSKSEATHSLFVN